MPCFERQHRSAALLAVVAAMCLQLVSSTSALAAKPAETEFARSGLPPLLHAHTWLLQGIKAPGGGCQYEYLGGSAEIPADGWELRAIAIDMANCRKLMEEGVPTQAAVAAGASQGASPGTSSQLLGPIANPASPSYSTAAVTSTKGAWQLVVWTDIIGVTVNHGVTQINWTYNGSIVLSGNAAGYWYHLGGWEILSTSVTQGFFSGAFRGQTTSTFRNQGFCGTGQPPVYVYHFYDRVWGHFNGTATRDYSTTSANECLPLFVTFQSAYGQWA